MAAYGSPMAAYGTLWDPRHLIPVLENLRNNYNVLLYIINNFTVHNKSANITNIIYKNNEIYV